MAIVSPARLAAVAFRLGSRRLARGDIRGAVRALERAWLLEPCVPTLHGVTLAALAAHDWTAAARYARLSTREDSGNPASWYHLGAAYHGAGRWEQAAGAFRRCLQRDPTHSGAHAELALLAGFRGDRAAERRHADAALATPAPDGYARYVQSLLQLWRGDYAAGWANYESRHGLPLVVAGWARPLGLDDRRRWQGGPVGRLLAHAEQGHGDAIQMARYLPLVRERCDALTVMVHRSLVSLCQQQARGRWRVLALDDPTPEHDAWVSFMSLPYLLGTDDLTKIPPPADFGVAASPRTSGGSPRVVALCTQGGAVASLDRDRSDHRGALYALRDAFPALTWVDFTGRTGDWTDTARELAGCDLLISVDTAIAHLAGSLGVETWLVPPTHYEWRWLDGRDDSPWYPRHRLYRRRHTRDWPGVVARLRSALEERTK
ncbi:MAG TPA: tetratricopeptide repeat protein [Gemmatimonadaceae bacterium]